MRLIVLGCTGSGPGPAAPASGYLVEAGEARLVLDLGNGTLGALQRHLDPWELDGVVLTHLHPDHCADMPGLVVHRRFRPWPPFDPTTRRLPVHAPAEAPDRLTAAYAPSAAERAETDLSDVLDFHVLREDDPAEVAGALVRARRVEHPCEAYALRVEHGGRSLVYSGDTGPCAALVELARGADVLLCEASWPHVTEVWDEPPPGLHMSGRQAGEHAAAAGVGRLLLTHVPPWFDGAALLAEAKEAFDGPVELVRADAGYAI
ncbi:MBL fold metallo-hydrolase [Pseudonocardia asaccharolytica]|uniref:MBL fold metallo-hydrolase n=1 Tax=Pseudonocardia asaccharolytica DSM 44247 = NBRC 16224 TaxID=1123024 RepID=A0A511D1M3_9PSEU|nr:MBL fold metallo-hydrolase [Pseudonocardia asaccharolytica]GEL18692.1 MBL fold metallo-hydrolase [Pseudonocardia asaccharolytica DSM 44247 = NBRC 16224]